MPVLEMRDRGGWLGLDEAACRAAGRALADRYRTADPFPHVVIDDLIDPSLLRQVVRDFPTSEGVTASDREQERLKRQFHPQDCRGAVTRNLFAELNSQAFLGFLAELTGLSGLIADPYYAGAGLHQTSRGGHLGIHADFNRHEIMNVERRLNLLVYLNDDWDESYGGALELWDRNMTGCRVRTYPVLGRAVIFATDLDSYHGHPDPLGCPPDRARRSLATYYYRAPEAGAFDIQRTTNFRKRPGTGDKRDWRIMLHHLANDWSPPVLRPLLRRRLRI
jgi:Rps23 Pro-64 3,4-dihydroxylase Tpa1-like proline 4-hydroxylase